MADTSTMLIALFLAGSTSGVILFRAFLDVIRGHYLADGDGES